MTVATVKKLLAGGCTHCNHVHCEAAGVAYALWVVAVGVVGTPAARVVV